MLQINWISTVQTSKIWTGYMNFSCDKVGSIKSERQVLLFDFQIADFKKVFSQDFH